jgi:hypothetical protein
LVLCEVANEEKLNAVGQKLESAGVSLRAFREPDIGDQLTAIATAPLGAEFRHLFRKYPLFSGASL